ncbi:AMP-binding acetyl-CoA synthetase [Solimonas sp. K1W22B-7]|uniref:AMP-binding protein n=1 Tax=Solimonas sp. K1W22B-7 TaxID=2303331 RepID=UPI000E32D4E2|nr:AMP-binding protein [Solimonas sp. K1W22B-7]AXQ31124.1 AMP-binding acetyl-CoA synthetase [Solimonas sp. K1W22B-7]
MPQISTSNLPLQCAYRWEMARANQVFLTQPIGGGEVRDYTWAQAMGEARSMAGFLQAQGYPAGSRIAIMSKNCAHWIMADLAIWMAGHVSVPLYPTLTAASVRQVLEHSEARAIFAGRLDAWDEMLRGVPDSVLAISFPSSPANTLPTWEEIVKGSAPVTGQPLRAADDLATIIYTSGTTGMPKGVMHSFANLAWSAESLLDLTRGNSADRALSYLPLSHVAERAGMEIVALRTATHLFFADSLETFLDDLRRARPTVFFSVPRLWVKFQQGVSSKLPEKKLKALLRIPVVGGIVRRKVLRQLGLDSVRLAVCGAAPMPEATLNWYRDLGLNLLEGYGMTEIFGVSHVCRPGQVKVGYVGQTMLGVECKLSDEGEILVRSRSNTLGYYKEPEKSQDLLTPDGYIRTGDKGTMDELGRLKITGRVKELFKTSKGKYVAPGPIENKLTAHPDVEACCVAGANQGQPCAMLMLSPEARRRAADPALRNTLAASLSAHLKTVNTSLDDHEQLDFVTVVTDDWNVDNGFLTPTLKIKRHVIEDAYGRHLDAWYAQRKPVIWQ